MDESSQRSLLGRIGYLRTCGDAWIEERRVVTGEITPSQRKPHIQPCGCHNCGKSVQLPVYVARVEDRVRWIAVGYDLLKVDTVTGEIVAEFEPLNNEPTIRNPRTRRHTYHNGHVVDWLVAESEKVHQMTAAATWVDPL